MFLNTRTAIMLAATSLLSMPVHAEPAHQHDAGVYIISPSNGAVVSSPVTVVFGLKGMGVAPAGVDKPGTGHHHLLVNAQSLPVMDQAIPSDEHHRHFGKGQTETTVELAPGTHTLQLVFGDKDHVPVGEHMVSDAITITVK